LVSNPQELFLKPDGVVGNCNPTPTNSGFKGTFSSQTLRAAGARIKGDGFAASIATGKPFALNDQGWSIEPQAQIVYQRLSFDQAMDGSTAPLPRQEGFIVAP